MICRYTARNIVPLSLELERDTRQARRVGVPGTSGEEGFRLGRSSQPPPLLRYGLPRAVNDRQPPAGCFGPGCSTAATTANAASTFWASSRGRSWRNAEEQADDDQVPEDVLGEVAVDAVDLKHDEHAYRDEQNQRQRTP